MLAKEKWSLGVHIPYHVHPIQCVCVCVCGGGGGGGGVQHFDRNVEGGILLPLFCRQECMMTSSSLCNDDDVIMLLLALLPNTMYVCV